MTDRLPSWRDGPTRRSMTSFVERVTTEGGADFEEALARARERDWTIVSMRNDWSTIFTDVPG